MIIAGAIIILLSIGVYLNSKRERDPFDVSMLSTESQIVLSIFLGVIGLAVIVYALGVRIDRPMSGKNPNSHFYLESNQ